MAMLNRLSCWRELRVFTILMTALLGSPSAANPQDLHENTSACSSAEVWSVFRILDRASNPYELGRPTRIWSLDETVDKSVFLSAFREPSFHSVHLFFPLNETDIQRAFDWNTIKRDQIDVLRLLRNDRSKFYILGSASNIGDPDLNRSLASQRVASTINYLLRNIGIKVGRINVGLLQKEQIQLSFNDAKFLNIPKEDFRADDLILNQSVHIIVFPCAEGDTPRPPSQPSARALQERSEIPMPVPLETQLRERLTLAQFGLKNRTTSLAIHKIGSREYYTLKDATVSLTQTQDILTSFLQNAGLKALKDYVEDTFAELTAEIHKTSIVASINNFQLAKNQQPQQRQTLALVIKGVADLVFERASTLIARLYKDSNNLSISVCIISTPDRANFALHPKQDPKGIRSVSTNGLIPDLWIGRYHYELTKSGFKTTSFDFDFLDDSSSVLECSLVKQAEKDEALACRPVDKKLKNRCRAGK